MAGNNVAGLTSLSNGGQALVLWQSGRLQALAVSGSTLNGRVVTRFESVSVNSQGDVAHFHNLKWQKQALDAAKNEFDACLSTCQ